MTRQLVAAGRLLDIPVYDHVDVGRRPVRRASPTAGLAVTAPTARPRPANSRATARESTPTASIST